MNENNIFVSDIKNIYSDSILSDKLYIPTYPRSVHVIAIIIDGQLINTLDGDIETVGENELLYVKSGSLDVSRSVNGSHYISVEFTALNNDFYLPRHTRFSSGSDIVSSGEKARKAYETMLKCWKNGQPGKKMKCFELLYGIFNYISDETNKNSDKSYKYNKVSAAIDYINLHCLEKSFRIEQLADVCNMSSVNLNRLFIELFNTTAGSYAQEKRIETAKKFLLNSQNTIGDVALRCGWSDIYSFSHAFKRITGKSPTDWRCNN